MARLTSPQRVLQHWAARLTVPLWHALAGLIPWSKHFIPRDAVFSLPQPGQLRH